jgi:uncharacterized protein YgiM (DUF1202 family)
MKIHAFLLSIALAFAGLAAAQEQAFTNRATELKDKAAADGKTVASLPADTEVKVISRGGSGWTQVDAKGQKGWVRVFHLRYPAAVQTASASGGGLSAITGALGIGRSDTQRTTTATTGIRGLSPEDLKNAAPDNAALAKAQTYRADKPSAERFARDGKLVTVSVEEGGRR